jgi:hypothetical protein
MQWCVFEHRIVLGVPSAGGGAAGVVEVAMPDLVESSGEIRVMAAQRNGGLGKILVQRGTLLQKTLKTV